MPSLDPAPTLAPMSVSRRVGLLSLSLLFVPACARDGDETLTIRMSEGTALAFDLTRDGEQIVFDLLGQLWLVPASGGEARAITDAVRDTAEDLDPAFAPDGRRVAFRGERNGRVGLWLLDLDSATPRQLTQLPRPEGEEGAPAWSPDGRALLFSRSLPPDTAGGRWRSDLVLRELVSGNERTLALDTFTAIRDPAWVGGNGEIGFVALPGRGAPGGRVWVVDTMRRAPRPVTVPTQVAAAPAFSPGGGEVAYFAPDSAGNPQVWLQLLDLDRAATGPARQVTRHDDVAPTRIRWTRSGLSVSV